MLPLLVLIVPPTVTMGGYTAWYAGQQVILQIQNLSLPPHQSTRTYVAGIASFVGSYTLAETMIAHYERQQPSGGLPRGTTTTTPSLSTPKTFVPPKSVAELVNRAGPPVFRRVGGAVSAFFVAGMVQTYLASKMNAK